MPKRLRPFLLSALLLIVISHLAALLAGEWFYLRNQRMHAIQGGAPAPAPPAETGLAPDDYALPGVAQYEQFVDRPLFMESRRPGQPPREEPPHPPPPE